MVLMLSMLVLVWAADRTLRRDLEQQTIEDLERTARLVRASIADDASGVPDVLASVHRIRSLVNDVGDCIGQ